MSIPTSHLSEAQKLEAEGEVHLYEITMLTGEKLFLKNNETADWQGNTYEGTAIEMDGIKTGASEEKSRPVLRTINPDGIFKPFVAQGLIEKATVVRRTVLTNHFAANNPTHRARTWLISRVTSMTSQSLMVELRSPLDGPNVIVPRRVYMPPMFPVVSVR